MIAVLGFNRAVVYMILFNVCKDFAGGNAVDNNIQDRASALQCRTNYNMKRRMSVFY